MTVDELVDLWLASSATGKQKPVTRWSYAADVRKVLQAFSLRANPVSQDDVERILQGLTRDKLAHYFRSLVAREIHRPATVARMIHSARVFLLFCVGRGLININPLVNFCPKWPRSAPRPRPTLSLDHLDTLRQAVKRPLRSTLPPRGSLVLELMVLGIGGLQLTKLMISDLDLGGGQLCLRDDSNRRRYLILSPEVRLLLHRYLEERQLFLARLGLIDSGVLFIGRSNEPLTDRALRRQLTLAAKELGVALDVRQLCRRVAPV